MLVGSLDCQLDVVEPNGFVRILPAHSLAGGMVALDENSLGLMSFLGLVLQCFLMASIRCLNVATAEWYDAVTEMYLKKEVGKIWVIF